MDSRPKGDDVLQEGGISVHLSEQTSEKTSILEEKGPRMAIERQERTKRTSKRIGRVSEGETVGRMEGRRDGGSSGRMEEWMDV